MYTRCLRVVDDYFIVDMINGEVILSSRSQQDTSDDEYEKTFHMSYFFKFCCCQNPRFIKITFGTNHFITIYDSQKCDTNIPVKFDLHDNLFDNFKSVLHTLYQLIPIKPLAKKDCYIVTLKDGTIFSANYVCRKSYNGHNKYFLNLKTIHGNTALFNSYNITDIAMKFGRYEGAWPEYSSQKQKLFLNWINSTYLAIQEKAKLEVKQLKNKRWIIKNPLKEILKELHFNDIAQMREYILEITGNKLGIFPEFKDKESLLKFIKERKNEL